MLKAQGGNNFEGEHMGSDQRQEWGGRLVRAVEINKDTYEAMLAWVHPLYGASWESEALNYLCHLQSAVRSITIQHSESFRSASRVLRQQT